VSERLLTPAELAAYLAVDRAFVYEHAADLGALRLSSGPRARLRFDLDEVKRRIGLAPVLASWESTAADSAPRAARRRPRRRPTGTNVDLLPIRGREAAS
jgi:hypothetical protein